MHDFPIWLILMEPFHCFIGCCSKNRPRCTHPLISVSSTLIRASYRLGHRGFTLLLCTSSGFYCTLVHITGGAGRDREVKALVFPSLGHTKRRINPVLVQRISQIHCFFSRVHCYIIRHLPPSCIHGQVLTPLLNTSPVLNCTVV